MKFFSRATLRTQIVALGLIPILFCAVALLIAGTQLYRASQTQASAVHIGKAADIAGELRVLSYAVQRETRAHLLDSAGADPDKARTGMGAILETLQKLVGSGVATVDVRPLQVIAADVRADMDTVLRLRLGRSGGAMKDGAQELSEASEAINRLLDRPAIHGQPALLSALAG
ncbi:MAG: hypothetical protein ACRCUX_01830, partial [Beijerinckiaceae bacterium]